MILYVIFIIIIIALVFFLFSTQKGMTMFRLKYEKYANKIRDLEFEFNNLEDKTCINKFNKIFPKKPKKKKSKY